MIFGIYFPSFFTVEKEIVTTVCQQMKIIQTETIQMLICVERIVVT